MVTRIRLLAPAGFAAGVGWLHAERAKGKGVRAANSNRREQDQDRALAASWNSQALSPKRSALRDEPSALDDVISAAPVRRGGGWPRRVRACSARRSEEHTSELQS